MVDRARRLVITGAAGLVGQNLVTLLAEHGYSNILALDKHKANIKTLQSLHPQITCVTADLAVPGGWTEHLAGANVVVQLHAQIAAKASEAFVRNNVRATEHVLDAVRHARVPFLIHASSSVVNSVADDDYTRSKKLQDKLVMESGLRWCILRPTLMFGWFDPKHLGWLANFMERTPVFPIPGHGRYMRQPLYNRDFCRAILACIDREPAGQTFDITGPERIDYIDMIHTIREVKGLRTPIVRVPYSAFKLALQLYALFSERPPFTADQLEALIAGDEFCGVDMERTFGFRPTPFKLALEQTFGHPVYSKIALDLPH